MSEILIVDKRQARLAFEKAAPTYDQVAFLQREIGQRLLERLEFIRYTPKQMLDVGAGTGYCTLKLHRHFPKAKLFALDMAHNMLTLTRKRMPYWSRWRRRCGFIVGDAEALPLADASVDMIFSNLTLQWCNDLPRVFAEFKRVLAPGGMLLFTTFGPDTLRELRASWSQVDGYSHVNGFFDMHDIGDALLRAQFAEPVMDVERLTITYQDSMTLMRDLKHLGAHNVTQHRNRGLTGRRRLQQLQQAYEVYRQDGVLPASYEVIYGHAWVAQAQAVCAATNTVSIPVASLQRVPQR